MNKIGIFFVEITESWIAFGKRNVLLQQNKMDNITNKETVV